MFVNYASSFHNRVREEYQYLQEAQMWIYKKLDII